MMLFTRTIPNISMRLKNQTVFFALALVACTLIFTSTAKKDGDYDWLKQRLETTRQYTLEVFNAMPDEHYDFRPTEEVRTFKAQAYHIVYSIDYFNRVFKGETQPAWNPGDENSKSKAELAKWAEEQFDAINATILAASNDEKLTAGIISYLDHNSHHRGQMTTYLRIKGITPPTYR